MVTLACRNIAPTERVPANITPLHESLTQICFLSYSIACISYWGNWDTEVLCRNICCQVLSSPNCFSWTFLHHPSADSALFQFLNQSWWGLDQLHVGCRLYLSTNRPGLHDGGMRPDWRAYHGALLVCSLEWSIVFLTGQLHQITAQDMVLHLVSQDERYLRLHFSKVY